MARRFITRWPIKPKQILRAILTATLAAAASVQSWKCVLKAEDIEFDPKTGKIDLKLDQVGRA